MELMSLERDPIRAKRRERTLSNVMKRIIILSFKISKKIQRCVSRLTSIATMMLSTNLRKSLPA
jgi:hypothetical protein